MNSAVRAEFLCGFEDAELCRPRRRGRCDAYAAGYDSYLKASAGADDCEEWERHVNVLLDLIKRKT